MYYIKLCQTGKTPEKAEARRARSNLAQDVSPGYAMKNESEPLQGRHTG